MARETEIKLKVTDVPAFHRALKRIGASPAGPGTSKVHEENVIFDTPQGGLAKHGQLLRIRTETSQTGSKPNKRAPNQRVMWCCRLVHRQEAHLLGHTRSEMRLRWRSPRVAI
ncbi:MAG: hypothetical protein DMG56_11085 [Acidobacteria bacterium]|nr:MAG: hypothetical protein DMG56_11085 [Acidobacteriota bacterium]